MQEGSFLLGFQEKEERHKREVASSRDDLVSSFPRPFANSQRLLRTRLRSLHNRARDEQLTALQLRKKIEYEENKATVGEGSRRGEEEERKRDGEEDEGQERERTQRKSEKVRRKPSAFILQNVTDSRRGDVLHDEEAEERNERRRMSRVKGKREEKEREQELEESRESARQKKEELPDKEIKARKEEEEVKKCPSKASPEEIPRRTHKKEGHRETRLLLSQREAEEVESLSREENDRENCEVDRRRGREGRRQRRSSVLVAHDTSSPSPCEQRSASVNIKIELATTGERLLLLARDTLQKIEERGKGEPTEKERRREDDRERTSSPSSSSLSLSRTSKTEGKKEEEEAKEILCVHHDAQAPHRSSSSSSVELFSGGEKGRSPSLHNEAVSDEKGKRRKREKAQEEEEERKKDRSLLLLLDVDRRDIGYYGEEYDEEPEKREEEEEGLFFSQKDFRSYAVENSLGVSHHQPRWRRERDEKEERRERRSECTRRRRTGGGREDRCYERYESNGDSSSSSPWKRLFNFSWLADDLLLEDEEEEEQENKEEKCVDEGGEGR